MRWIRRRRCHRPPVRRAVLTSPAGTGCASGYFRVLAHPQVVKNAESPRPRSRRRRRPQPDLAISGAGVGTAAQPPGGGQPSSPAEWRKITPRGAVRTPRYRPLPQGRRSASVCCRRVIFFTSLSGSSQFAGRGAQASIPAARATSALDQVRCSCREPPPASASRSASVADASLSCRGRRRRHRGALPPPSARRGGRQARRRARRPGAGGRCAQMPGHKPPSTSGWTPGTPASRHR